MSNAASGGSRAIDPTIEVKIVAPFGEGCLGSVHLSPHRIQEGPRCHLGLYR